MLDPILAAGQWRVAFNTAYDIYRHAAEAVDLAAGYRILAAPGAHATLQHGGPVGGTAGRGDQTATSAHPTSQRLRIPGIRSRTDAPPLLGARPTNSSRRRIQSHVPCGSPLLRPDADGW